MARARKRKSITRAVAVASLLHRVFLQFGEHLKDPETGEPLTPNDAIQFDHHHGHELGGPHDYKNIRPMLVPSHKCKTKRETRDRAHVKRLRNPSARKGPVLESSTFGADSRPIKSSSFGRRA